MDWMMFESYFKSIYFSYKIGSRKPEIEIFNKFVRCQNINADETIYLDDSKINIEAAEKMGFRTELVTDKKIIEVFNSRIN
jgi:putative hydrolase of the HAD superfamily